VLEDGVRGRESGETTTDNDGLGSGEISGHLGITQKMDCKKTSTCVRENELYGESLEYVVTA